MNFHSAGMEGMFGRLSVPPSDISMGRYETALLCLGTMHCHFGHSKKALEVKNYNFFSLSHLDISVCLYI